MPLVTPKAAPFKPEKTPEAKKEDKSKALHLRNEMGLECGHKVSAKEVKKFNLKPVPKQPPKTKPEPPEDKPETAPPAVFLKAKPVVKPKPVPAAKPEPPAENKLDITNLRSKLRPSKPVDPGSDANHHNGSPAAATGPCPNSPPSSPPIHIPPLNNGKSCEEPKLPPKHVNGHSQESSSPPAKPAVPPHKEVPQRPPAMAPRRPPPPKMTDPSSPTELKPLPILKDAQDPPPKAGPPQLSRPPPPKPKGFVPPNKEKDEPKVNKVPIPPKPHVKSDKPGPPKDKLPPLLRESSRDELYLAVADFEGDDQTSGFKVGTVFEVLEKNSSGWWFCKNLGEENESWIPSNYLSKKP